MLNPKKNISRKSRQWKTKHKTKKKTEDKSRVNDNYHPVSRIFSLLPANVVFYDLFFFRSSLLCDLNTQACMLVCVRYDGM